MFLQNLRQQTAPCHEALEHNLLSVSLMKETVSLANYTSYLKKLYGFVYVFEQNIFPLLQPLLPDLNKRKKTHLLQADLISQTEDLSTLSLPDKTFICTSYPNLTAALGGMYVLEGSTLGGQIIQRHLHKFLGEGAAQFQYFEAYGKETGRYWKTFLQHLCQAADSPEKQEVIIATAIQTFSFINSWMTTGTFKQPQNEHQEFSK